MTDLAINTDMTIRAIVPKKSSLSIIQPEGRDLARVFTAAIYGIVQGKGASGKGYSWVHVSVYLQGDAFSVPVVKGGFYQITGIPYLSIGQNGSPKLCLWVRNPSWIVLLRRHQLAKLKQNPVLRELRQTLQ